MEVEQIESQAQEEEQEEEEDEIIQNEEEKALETGQGSEVFCKEEIITEIEIVHTREEEEEKVMEDRKENEIVAEPVVVAVDKQEEGTEHNNIQREFEIGIDNLKEEVKVLQRKVRHRANSEIKRLEVCQEEEEDVLVEATAEQIDRELVSDLSIFSFCSRH